MKKLTKENNLGTIYPEISKEWHPTRNDITSSDVLPGSGKKFWWLCPKNHEYQAKPNHRTNGTGCPYCNNKKASFTNNLGVCYPEIAKEWHPTRNDIAPSDVLPKSNKKFWWLCPKNHEYQAAPNHRTNGTDCPYCNNRIVSSTNNLAICYPEIAKDWHPTRNGEITPYNVMSGSGKKYWWLCPKNHEYYVSPNNRGIKRGCPYCSNHKVSSTNNLAIRFPEIAKEWHPTKNDITPFDVLPKGKKKYWWLCPKNHEYKSAVYSRTDGITGCPKCKKSKGEIKISELLEILNINFKEQFRFNNCRYKKCLPFDFYLPDYNICIEYHGKQHYMPVVYGSMSKTTAKDNFKYQKIKDKIKKNYCLKNEINFLEISYKEFDLSEKIIKNYLLTRDK